MSNQDLLFQAFADTRDELGLVRLHQPDQLRIFRFFVLRGPQDKFREYRGEINALGGELVNEFSPVGGIGLCGDDAMSDQFAQAVRQNVAGDAFVRGQKLRRKR